MAFDQMDHDEGNENHAQQRELVGSGEDLGKLHEVRPAIWAAAFIAPRALFISTSRLIDGGKNQFAACRPVVTKRRSDNDGTAPLCMSSSMRSTRCMGKKTTAGVQDSPSRTMAARSSKDARSTPQRLKPAGAVVRTMPQNFAFGLLKLTTASVPGANGSRSRAAISFVARKGKSFFT